MRALIFAAAAALGLAACASLTDATGLTVEQQLCIANAVAVMANDPAFADQSYTARIAWVAAQCLVTPAEVQGFLAQ